MSRYHIGIDVIIAIAAVAILASNRTERGLNAVRSGRFGHFHTLRSASQSCREAFPKLMVATVCDELHDNRTGEEWTGWNAPGLSASRMRSPIRLKIYRRLADGGDGWQVHKIGPSLSGGGR